MTRRFEPFRELMTLQDRMNRLFGELGLQQPSEGEPTTTWSPPVDIYETPREIVMLFDLPGLKQDDFHVNIERDRLIVRGERKPDAEVERDSFHRNERPHGPFARTFTLPPNVDQEQIRADYGRSGVLKLTLPKRELAQARQININLG